MALVMAQLFGQITPSPEHEVGLGLPFPHTDNFGIAKIGNLIQHWEQQPLLADPDTDDFAI